MYIFVFALSNEEERVRDFNVENRNKTLEMDIGEKKSWIM